MNKSVALALTLVVGVLIGLFVGPFIAQTAGWQSGMKQSSGHDHADAPRKVSYWYDPMKPEVHFPQAGKSPFMDMELVPRYADEDTAAGAPGLGLAPVFTQNLGVKTARVEKGMLARTIEVSGSVAFDEHAIALLQARTGGIVERAWPLAVGDQVRAGQPLADIRVPEWFAAQREYLVLRDMPGLGAAARSRLLQLGMSAEEIATVEKRAQPHAIVTLRAPRAGMLAEFDLHQGMTISAGQSVARINGLDSVWVEAQTPEIEAARLALGDKVEVRFHAFPNQIHTGHISALLPELNREARTVRVRIHLPNPEGRLRPGMFAQVRVEEAGADKERLLVPADAIIATGKRQVVIIATENGRFVPTEVKAGIEADNRTEILEGVKEGEHIVVSGQFMIDSEASLRGVLARMASDAPPADVSEPRLYTGTGTVKSVAATEIVLAHGAIPELGWPAMTMAFALSPGQDAVRPVAGQRVRFHFRESDAGSVIQQLEILPE
ncbi:cobalt transporter [Betaproteobacteria bacterium]|nr:cobalt transporter [Betaproteobacteria bacterium]